MSSIRPVVISEVMYHPPDHLLGTGLADNTDDEFIEHLGFAVPNVQEAAARLNDHPLVGDVRGVGLIAALEANLRTMKAAQGARDARDPRRQVAGKGIVAPGR